MTAHTHVHGGTGVSVWVPLLLALVAVTAIVLVYYRNR